MTNREGLLDRAMRNQVEISRAEDSVIIEAMEAWGLGDLAGCPQLAIVCAALDTILKETKNETITSPSKQ